MVFSALAATASIGGVQFVCPASFFFFSLIVGVGEIIIGSFGCQCIVIVIFIIIIIIP
jgi:hypothetical protein